MGTGQTAQSRFWTSLAMPHINLLATGPQRSQARPRVEAGMPGSLKELQTVALKYYNLKIFSTGTVLKMGKN